jgi:hypothetical protein
MKKLRTPIKFGTDYDPIISHPTIRPVSTATTLHADFPDPSLRHPRKPRPRQTLPDTDNFLRIDSNA